MIKRGLVGFDDYMRFGGMLDSLERAGAVNIMWIPKKSEVVVIAPRSKYDAIKRVLGYDGKINRGLSFFKIRWH